MKKELGEAPLHIEGWLILPAIYVLTVLYQSFEALFKVLYILVIHLFVPLMTSAGYEDIIKYIQEDFPKTKGFSSGLVPGFWLCVPDGWRYIL